MSSPRKLMLRLYWWMERIIAPGLKNSQYRYLDVLDSCVKPQTCWLDLGCGHQIIPDWMQPSMHEKQDEIVSRCDMITGIDMDAHSLEKNSLLVCKVLGDIQRLPFENESFNLVTANMVMEHVEDPCAVLSGVRRVLKPGGLFIFHTPNRLHYATLLNACIPSGVRNGIIHFLEGRCEDDVFPTHYRINTAGSIMRFAGRCDFEAVEISAVESTAQAVMLGPVAALELLLIRALRLKMLANYRDSIIAVLRRPV